MTSPKTPIIGRSKELQQLTAIANSKRAELIAVYGRRRVGKTFLIREFFKPISTIQFCVTGIKDGAKETQLLLFQEQLEKVFYSGERIPTIQTWKQAFDQLLRCLKNVSQKIQNQPMLVFLDELPWLSTPKSGLLEAFDHAWNTELKELSSLKFVICGSAASWMIKKVVNSKGGLHNRLTGSMRLMPFNLKETQAFFHSKGISYNPQQTIEAYMAFGGVPYYLDHFKRGLSAAQNIAALGFGQGELAQEFDKLYASLFEDSTQHLKIIQALSSKNKGLTRTELLQKTKLPSGGKLSDWLKELEEAGFIENVQPFGKTTKDALYRIIDEYTWFALKWQKHAPKGVFKEGGQDFWLQQIHSPSYAAWASFNFETICLKHHLQIKAALGFQSVFSEASQWNSKEAQIDLLFDRADRVILLCEIKYSENPFVIQKKYFAELQNKKTVFQAKTKTKKQILFAMITLNGLTQNNYSQQIIDAEITALDLF